MKITSKFVGKLAAKSTVRSLFVSIFFFGSMMHSPAASAKPVASPANGITSLAKKKNMGTLITVLQTQMSGSDAGFIAAASKKSGVHRGTKLEITNNSKDSFAIKGLGKFDVRLGGREIIYRGLAFRLKPNMSLQRNIEDFNKRLSHKNASNWLFPTAHAQTDDDSHSALMLGGALSYLSMYENSTDFKSVNQLAEDGNVTSFLGYDDVKPMKSASCDYDNSAGGTPSVRAIRINQRDGKVLYMTDGKNPNEVMVQMNGGPATADPYSADMYKTLKGSFCSITSEDERTRVIGTVNRLLEKIPKNSDMPLNDDKGSGVAH